jgi:hypothetical protein
MSLITQTSNKRSEKPGARDIVVQVCEMLLQDEIEIGGWMSLYGNLEGIMGMFLAELSASLNGRADGEPRQNLVRNGITQ